MIRARCVTDLSVVLRVDLTSSKIRMITDINRIMTYTVIGIVISLFILTFLSVIRALPLIARI